jgi:hypothetical protein
MNRFTAMSPLISRVLIPFVQELSSFRWCWAILSNVPYLDVLMVVFRLHH